MTVLLDRWQFGVTITYHFLFVPLTIGLAFLVAIMQVLAYRRKDAVLVLVDHGDLHWDPAQGLGGAELGKARSDDHHAGLESAHAGRPSVGLNGDEVAAYRRLVPPGPVTVIGYSSLVGRRGRR